MDSVDGLDSKAAAPSTTSASLAREGRREFLAKAASGVFAGLVVGGLRVEAEAPPPPASFPSAPFSTASQVEEDVLIRMQRDVERALQKPIEQRRWGMVIDTRKCVACDSCTVGCVMENKLPPGVVYRPVIDMEVGTYPNVSRKFLPRPCMQCDNPPCVPVCPVAATFKRPDGIVEIDYDACIGCRYCLTACPYEARTFDFGEEWTDTAAAGKPGALALDEAHGYELEPSYEYGEPWVREPGGALKGLFEHSPIGNARKCHFCVHRVEKGMLPMCVTTCMGRATYFGDLNDPSSLVSELAALTNATRLKEELGTEPKVYYLV